jgi:hypothetical protein
VGSVLTLTDWSYWAKLALFLLLPVDLTVFAILPSLRWAIGRPLDMFFRPDLLFGDGRVLCCGTIAFVLGMRYFVGHPPPPGVQVPIPKWDWFGIYYAIVLGFIPLIAVRGMLKLLMRMRRIRDERWGGWVATAARELVLVVTVLNIGFGFHNVFKGLHPFAQSHTAFHNWTWVPALTLAAAALWLVFVRGGFKRLIGEPFIKETLAHTFIKQMLYVIGLLVLMWSFMSILDTEPEDIKHAGFVQIHPPAVEEAPGHMMPMREVRRWPDSGFALPGIKGIIIGPWNWVGLGLFLWGFVVLVPFRMVAQHYQRQAIVGQMAAVVLPRLRPGHRRRILAKMIQALVIMPEGQRQAMMRAMLEGLSVASPTVRALMAQERLSLVVELPADVRRQVMRSQAAALRLLGETERVGAMADMMGAAATLSADKRQIVMKEMDTLMRGAAWG